jgi:hypothetical protein
MAVSIPYKGSRVNLAGAPEASAQEENKVMVEQRKIFVRVFIDES